MNNVPVIFDAIDDFLEDTDRGSGTTPKAYINWILFDENFRFVNGNFSRVGATNTVKAHGGDSQLQDVVVTKNGYLYVYCSNESPVKVFFDNLQVIHTRGRILEETHYYPFGLAMTGISSQSLNFGKENKSKFNGIEQNTSFDLNMYDALYRNLDPQIGRFWQIDPKLVDEASPYSAMGNNPISMVDPLGDTTYYYDTPTGHLHPFLKELYKKTLEFTFQAP